MAATTPPTVPPMVSRHPLWQGRRLCCGDCMMMASGGRLVLGRGALWWFLWRRLRLLDNSIARKRDFRLQISRATLLWVIHCREPFTGLQDLGFGGLWLHIKDLARLCVDDASLSCPSCRSATPRRCTVFKCLFVCLDECSGYDTRSHDEDIGQEPRKWRADHVAVVSASPAYPKPRPR